MSLKISCYSPFDNQPELDGAEEGGGDGPLDQNVDGHDQLGHNVAQGVQGICTSQ